MVEERPYDQRPAARPLQPPPSPSLATSDEAPPLQAKKRVMGPLFSIVGLAAAVVGVILIVNLNQELAPEAATPKCDDAFAAASSAMDQHYATHPLFGAEYDAIYADGAVTDEEQVTLDAMLADEEARFVALIDPIYDACSGVEDLYAGGFAHREDADWALVDVESMSREEIKAGFIFAHCYEKEARPACSDFVLEDWNRKL